MRFIKAAIVALLLAWTPVQASKVTVYATTSTQNTDGTAATLVDSVRVTWGTCSAGAQSGQPASVQTSVQGQQIAALSGVSAIPGTQVAVLAFPTDLSPVCIVAYATGPGDVESGPTNVLVYTPLAAPGTPTPPTGGTVASGWNKIPSTAMCGGGTEKNASYGVPANFPGNLGLYTAYGASHLQGFCTSLMTDSNSGVYDTSRHRLVLYGGGHNNYWGNDLFAVDSSGMTHLDYPANPYTCASSGTGTVTQADGAVCKYNSSGALAAVLALPRCSYVSGCTPSKVTPGSGHTYNAIVYIPTTDQMVVFGGTSAPNGNGMGNIWLLGMSSVAPSCAPACDPAWSVVGGNPAANNTYVNPGNVGAMAAWDPNTQGVWVQTTYNLEWYDPKAQTIAIKNNNGIGYHSTGVIDPDDHLFIFIGPQSSTIKEGILYTNIAAGSTYAMVRPVITGCVNLTGGTNTAPQYMGAAWDPIGKRVVIYPNGGNVIWYLDPKTWTCTTQTYGTTQGTDYPQNTYIVGGQSGTFGHFAYDPTLDIFILCNDPHNDCWYLRPSR